MFSLYDKWRGLKSLLKFDNKWELIIQRLLFHSPVLVYRYRGMDILVDHLGGDSNGMRDCLADNSYRQYLHLIDKSKPINILDIGASVGGLPLLLKSEGFNLHRVVCLEFNPNTYQRLHFNVARNLGPQCTCKNVAVASSSGDLSFYPGRGGTGNSIESLKIPSQGEIQLRSVRVQSLDEVIEEQFPNELIDLCKIDIEGAEHNIFRASSYKKLLNCAKLLIELHGAEQTAASIERIEALGFTCLAKHQVRDATIAFFGHETH